MGRKRRLFRILGLLALVIILVGYVAGSLYAYGVLSIPRRHFSALSPSQTFEDVTFTARNQSYKVNAYFIPGRADKPAIINVHGNTGSRNDPNVRKVTDEMNALGYTVLAVDLSDHGGDTVGNGRSSLGYDERWDVLGAYDYLMTRGFTPDRIGLFGMSLGAASDLLAAALDSRIRAIWADSSYATTTAILTEQAVKQGFPGFIVPGGMAWGALLTGSRIWEANPLDAAGALAANKQTVYLIHCDHDPYTDVHHGRDLAAAYKSAGVEYTYWEPACDKHSNAFYQYTEDYVKRMDAFFTQALKSQG
jgi:uncharacterized protein